MPDGYIAAIGLAVVQHSRIFVLISQILRERTEMRLNFSNMGHSLPAVARGYETEDSQIDYLTILRTGHNRGIRNFHVRLQIGFTPSEHLIHPIH
jgi:hypothetical protein